MSLYLFPHTSGLPLLDGFPNVIGAQLGLIICASFVVASREMTAKDLLGFWERGRALTVRCGKNQLHHWRRRRNWLSPRLIGQNAHSTFWGNPISATLQWILLQVELVGFAQFVARVYLLLENSQIIPDMTILWKNVSSPPRSRRRPGWVNFIRLKRTVRRLHDQRPALPSSRQTFYEHILLFQPERFDHSLSSIADQIRKRHL